MHCPEKKCSFILIALHFVAANKRNSLKKSSICHYCMLWWRTKFGCFRSKSNVEQHIHVHFDRENRKEILQPLDNAQTYSTYYYWDNVQKFLFGSVKKNIALDVVHFLLTMFYIFLYW